MTKLLFPQELEVWYVLPAIRKRLAIGLIAKGQPQKAVAKLMGVTEAAISQYKKEKRANSDFLGTEFDEEIYEAIDKINNDGQHFFSEVMKLNNIIKHSETFCNLHKKVVPTELPCDSCELKVCIASVTNNRTLLITSYI